MSYLEDYLKERNSEDLLPEIEKYLKNKRINKDELNEILEEINKHLKSNNINPKKYSTLIRFVTAQLTSGLPKILKQRELWELLYALLILDGIKRNSYSTSLIYTSQVRNEGLGYYFKSEKVSENEILSESLKHFESFYRVQWYSRDEGYLYEINANGAIKEELRKIINYSAWDEKNGFSFSMIAKLNPFIIATRKGGKETLILKFPNLVLFSVVDYILTIMFRENKRPSYEDFAEIYVISNRLVNRRYFIFPNISEIYDKFYSSENDYVIREMEIGLEGEKAKTFEGSKLSRFLFSLWIRDKDYKESAILLDKLIYYLFTHTKLNGEILNKLTISIISYSLQKERKVKVLYQEYIFKKLWNIDIMEPRKIKEWGRNLGCTILSEKYKNAKNLDDKRAKKIIERIINELKVENLPGRFFNKTLELISKYEIEKYYEQSSFISELLTDEKIRYNMDNFFYIKSLILFGMLDALNRSDNCKST